MHTHDHLKLEPHVQRAIVAYNQKDFEQFTSYVQECILEMREHIHWENKDGVLHELDETHPELHEEIEELRSDHKFLLASLEEMKLLARKNDPQSFEIFEQFLKLRRKHVDHEDELYINTHTIELKN